LNERQDGTPGVTTPAPPRRFWVRAGRWLVRGVVTLLLVIVLVPLLAFASLRIEAVRTRVALLVDSALAPIFQGRIRIESIDAVDFGRVAVHARVEDSKGRTVITARGAKVFVFWPRLVFGLVTADGPPTIFIDQVEIDHAEVRLIDDGTGSPTLVTAFEPKTPSPPSSEPPPTVELPTIRLKHAWIHGALTGAPPIDAELSAFLASFRTDATALNLELKQVQLAARGLPYRAEPRGTLRAKLLMAANAAEPEVEGDYRGTIADVGIEADGQYRGGKLLAKLFAKDIDQRTLARFNPELALRGKAEASVHAEGTLPEVAFDADVRSEVGRVHAKGKLRLEEVITLQASVLASSLDVSGVVRTAPVTGIDLSADLTGRIEGERIDASYDVSVPTPLLGTERLPSVTTRGKLSQTPKLLSVEGNADVDEPGARTNIDYRVEMRDPGGFVEARTKTVLANPKRLATLAAVSARGKLETALRLSLPKQELAGQVRMQLEGARQGENRVGPSYARVELGGTLQQPHFDAKIDAENAVAAERSFQRVKLSLIGTPKRARLNAHLYATAPNEMRLAAELRLENGLEVIAPDITLTDVEGPVRIQATRVAATDGSLDIDELTLTGAGTARAMLRKRGGNWRVKADTTALEVARITRLAGVLTPLTRARATLAVDAELSPRAARGSVRGRIEDLDYEAIRGGRADIDLKLEQQKLTGRVETRLSQAGAAVLSIEELEVPGPPLALPSPDRLLARVRLEGTLDLASLSPLLVSMPDVPIGEAKGRIVTDVIYERTSLEQPPRLEAKLKTQGLELSGKRTRKEPIQTTGEARAANTWTYRGLDLDVSVALDARERRLALVGKAHDKHGDLVHVDASAYPLPPWAGFAALSAAVTKIPLRVLIDVPERPFRRFPPGLRPLSLRGNMSAQVDMRGSIDAPALSVNASFRRLGAAAERIEGQPPERIDVDLTGKYTTAGGELAVRARRGALNVASVDASWDGDARKFDVTGKRTPVEAKLRADFAKFELETIPALKNRQIGGRLSGSAMLVYGAEKREVDVKLNAEQLELAQVMLDRMDTSILLREGALRGQVTVRGKSGSLDVGIQSGLSWKDSLTPRLDGAIDGKLSARSFRLGALSPLFAGSVSELDGRLDANLRARVEGGSPRFSGSGRLTEGVVQIPAVGQRFESISARIAVQPTEIRLEDVRARGLSGGLTAASVLRFDQHLALRQATAAVRIAKNDKIPITTEGVAMGDAWGAIDVDMQQVGEQQRLNVVVSEFHLEMPEATPNSVQSLEPAAGVRVGVRQQDKKFTALPVQPLEGEEGEPPNMLVSIELGKTVWLRRGDLVNVQLTGKLQAEVTEQTRVTGQIRLRDGTLDVQGKRFEIESGTVTFTGGDPANPTVTALARWEAPIGYTVYANYAGTAEDGKLTLRSEPPLTEDQILSLILFGTTDGSFGSGGGDSTATAVGVAGGTAAKGLNRAISDLTNLDIQARIDTSTGTARPELVVPITPRLSARVTRAIGEPTPGASPDRTFLTLELRLKRNWALSGLVGDRGASALDLIWRHRY
jgi:autotransporter translocation and assembly factor TamB